VERPAFGQHLCVQLSRQPRRARRGRRGVGAAPPARSCCAMCSLAPCRRAARHHPPRADTPGAGLPNVWQARGLLACPPGAVAVAWSTSAGAGGVIRLPAGAPLAGHVLAVGPSVSIVVHSVAAEQLAARAGVTSRRDTPAPAMMQQHLTQRGSLRPPAEAPSSRSPRSRSTARAPRRKSPLPSPCAPSDVARPARGRPPA
jgi:hypothetical protein